MDRTIGAEEAAWAPEGAVVVGRIVYRADREVLVRDGGCHGPERWYAVRVDPREGRVIDRTVPAGYFRTMRECHAAIASHAFRLQTAAPGCGWTTGPA